jgi:hypothetical protein
MTLPIRAFNGNPRSGSLTSTKPPDNGNGQTLNI